MFIQLWISLLSSSAWEISDVRFLFKCDVRNDYIVFWVLGWVRDRKKQMKAEQSKDGIINLLAQALALNCETLDLLASKEPLLRDSPEYGKLKMLTKQALSIAQAQ